MSCCKWDSCALEMKCCDWLLSNKHIERGQISRLTPNRTRTVLADWINHYALCSVKNSAFEVFKSGRWDMIQIGVKKVQFSWKQLKRPYLWLFGHKGQVYNVPMSSNSMGLPPLIRMNGGWGCVFKTHWALCNVKKKLSKLCGIKAPKDLREKGMVRVWDNMRKTTFLGCYFRSESVSLWMIEW